MADETTLEIPPANVTIVGLFNAAIVRPEWVSRRVFDGRRALTTTMFPVGVGGPTIFKREEITWWVQHDRLVVAAQPIRPAAEFASKVIRELAHTPMQAVGINFVYTRELPSDSPWVRRLSELRDHAGLLGIGTGVGLTLKSKIGPHAVVTMNLSSQELPSCSVDFNFHRDVQGDEDERVSAIDDHISQAEVFEQESARVVKEIAGA
jgi:hypothetical protein